MIRRLRRLALWLVPLPLVLGCAGSLGESRHAGRVGLAPDSPRCQALDDRHSTWSAIAEGAGVLAGGSGLSTVPAEDKRLETGLAIGSVVAGATAAAAVMVASGAATSYAAECQ